ncbi:MAG: hypothetical protein K2K13_07625 [Clostridiales bacterium]|nr:hypothetical protein [Clostridiales bacterium]
MPEKKTVLAVMLGVSFVSLVVALIAGFVDSLMLFTDFNINYSPIAFIALSELAVIMLGIALVLIFLLLKNNRKKALTYTCIALVALAILSLIVIRVIISDYVSYASTIYALYTSYVATAITVTVSSILLVVSYMFLLKQQNSKTENSVQEINENVEQSAQSKDNQSEN